LSGYAGPVSGAHDMNQSTDQGATEQRRRGMSAGRAVLLLLVGGTILGMVSLIAMRVLLGTA
jgi:hypothetical protein